MTNRYYIVSLLLLLSTIVVHAQSRNQDDRTIDFPDVPGYQTLVCDFHIHTVFSDGSVWPDIRVQEAIRDGIDAISLTDHLEYQPHKGDLPHQNRNRGYEIALAAAADTDLIVLNGSEITRDYPPGHANAIFLEDANRLLIDDSVAVFAETDRQGAFTFWNHPAWLPTFKDGVAKISDMHLKLIESGQLHGIEIFNDQTYSDEALQMALDHNLTILASSDIHNLIDWRYHVPSGGHRPVTLVFAETKSKEGIAEALRAGRTVAWFKNVVAGREEMVVPLLEASLVVKSAAYMGESSVLTVEVSNISDADFVLNSKGPYGFHDGTGVLSIRRHSTETFAVKTLQRVTELDLVFEAMNAVIAPGTHPVVTISVEVE